MRIIVAGITSILVLLTYNPFIIEVKAKKPTRYQRLTKLLAFCHLKRNESLSIFYANTSSKVTTKNRLTETE